MTALQLIQIAADITEAKQLGDNSAGSVGCALLAKNGKVFTGVCIDTGSSMGFCAEHNAIGSMITEQVYNIQKIVAVWKNEKGEVHVLHPCGRCREFMRQINLDNMDTEVILAKDRVVKLKTLLPYQDDYAKVEL
jgi:cytidine deaminase